MTDNRATSALLWPAILAASAVGGSWIFACIAPFAALAALAQRTMPLRVALATVAAAWAVNQIVGFGLLGYPIDAYSLSWGAALLAGSLAGAGAARLVDLGAGLPRLALAFVAAFAWYEVTLFALSLAIGGTEMFAADIVAQVLRVDLAFFVGLTALHLALARLSPRLFTPRPAALTA